MIKSAFHFVKKNKSVRSLGIYTILNFINAAIPFLLLPVLTKYLSKADYGIIDMFANISYILMPLVGLNVSSSIIRFYFDRGKINFEEFTRTIILFLLTFGAVILILIIGLDFFTNIKIKGIPNSIIILSVVYAVFSQICEIILSIWRAEEKAFNFGAFRIIKTSMDLGLSVVLIVVLNYGWEGRVYPMFAISFLFAILAIYLLKKRESTKVRFNKNYLKNSLAYSTPLVFHSLSASFISFSDRFVILHYLDIESVATYGVAYQIGMVMSFVNSSFNQAWTPYLFLKLKENNISTLRKLHKFNYIYFLIMLFLALIIYLFVPMIYDVFIGENFHIDPYIVLWILLGYALNGMYKIVVNYLFYYKKTAILATYAVVSAIVNLVCAIILVPMYGILGAAISTTIAFFILFLLVYIYYIKNIKIN